MKRVSKSIFISVICIIIFAVAVAAKPILSPCKYYDLYGIETENQNCLETKVTAKNLSRLQFHGKYATLFSPDRGWMYVNRKGYVVVEGVMWMDGGADYIQDGFVRYESATKPLCTESAEVWG